jgi:quercetin dioxygenase-like cupin family protein
MKFETAKTYKIADSVEYSKESIVSKSVLKQAAGNISLFAFDKGEGLAEHSSPHDALMQVLDGNVDITIDGKLYQLTAGEGIILPANIPHALHAKDRFKMMLTMIKS